jgi:hypothetical protein
MTQFYLVFRIPIDLNTDPVPAFEVNTGPDPYPGFFMTKKEENAPSKKFKILYFQIAKNLD